MVGNPPNSVLPTPLPVAVCVVQYVCTCTQCDIGLDLALSSWAYLRVLPSARPMSAPVTYDVGVTDRIKGLSRPRPMHWRRHTGGGGSFSLPDGDERISHGDFQYLYPRYCKITLCIRR